jgi:hypothetical protein
MVRAFAGDSTMTRRRPFAEVDAPVVSDALPVFGLRVVVVFLGMLILLSALMARFYFNVQLLERKEYCGAHFAYRLRNDSHP